MLRGYLRPHARELAWLAPSLLAATLLPLVGPQLVRRFVDDAIAGRPVSTLVAIAGIYLAAALTAQGCQVATAWFAGRMAWRVTNRLREDLAEHVLGLDTGFHLRHTTGELIERIDGDVFRLSEFLSRFLLQVVSGGVLLLGMTVLVWLEDVRVGLTLTLFLAAAGVVVVRIQRRAVPTAAAERAAVASVLGNIEERLAAAEDLRALGAGVHSVNRFYDACAFHYRTHVRWQLASGATVVATNLLFAVGTALMVGVGAVLLSRGDLTLGAVLMLFQYSTMVRRPIEQIVSRFKELQEAMAGAARIGDLLAVRPTIVERPGGGQPLPANGALAVRLERVTFAYPDAAPVLHEVTLELDAGRSLGLVGRTGSGKTTLARLLLRLYDPTQGAVVVGGVDLREASLSSLRARVRAVTQDVQLFAADLRDNLTLFANEGEADDERMVEVLDELGLGAWFRSLPMGLDTPLGPGGTGVSAGEAQLLAFARVFLADPGLVVLDEASSRLDPATEALIDGAVDRLLGGRTAILIAHRLSSLRRVDEIAVIDGGRVVEHGLREELEADSSSRFGHLLSVATGGPA